MCVLYSSLQQFVRKLSAGSLQSVLSGKEHAAITLICDASQGRPKATAANMCCMLCCRSKQTVAMSSRVASLCSCCHVLHCCDLFVEKSTHYYLSRLLPHCAPGLREEYTRNTAELPQATRGACCRLRSHFHAHQQT